MSSYIPSPQANAPQVVHGKTKYQEMQDVIQRVRDLHRKVTRWGNEDMSISAEEHAENEAEGEWPELDPFDVCAECARIEMSAEQRGDDHDLCYLESVWPCTTIKALDGEDKK